MFAAFIAAFAAFANTLVGSVLINAAIVFGAASVSRYQARKQQRKADEAIKDREITVTGGAEPRQIVYGRSRVGGVLLYAASHGAENEKLSMVIAIAGHPIDAVEQVWLGDVNCGTPAGGTGNSLSLVVDGHKFWKSKVTAAQDVTTHPGIVGNVHTIVGAKSADQVSIGVTTWTDANGVSYQQAALQQGVDYSVSYTAGTKTLTITYMTTQMTQLWIDPTQDQPRSIDLAGRTLNINYLRDDGKALVTCEYRLGSEATDAARRYTSLETATAALTDKWTANHLCRGTATLMITFTYDDDEAVFSGGAPNVSAVIRGKKVVTNLGTLATDWSQNSALIVRDYLTDRLYGFGCANAEIDDTLLATQVTACDMGVGISGPPDYDGEAQYTCDIALSSDIERKSALEYLLSSMVGTAVYSGGKWLVRAGVYAAPSVTLDDSDLADGDITITSRLARSELFNAIRGTFRDESKGWEESDFPLYRSSVFGLEDGGPAVTVTAITKANPGVVTAPNHGFTSGDTVTFDIASGMTQLDSQNNTLSGLISVTDANTFTLVGHNTTSYGTFTSGVTRRAVWEWEDFQFAATTAATRAQRMAKLIMYRARQAVKLNASWKLTAYPLQPGDRVYVTLERYGFSSKIFRITGRTFDPSRMVLDLEMQEDAASVYDWNYSELLVPDPAPNTSLPVPWLVPPVSGLTAVSSAQSYEIASDGSYRYYVLVQWTPPPEKQIWAIHLFYKQAADTEFNRHDLKPYESSFKIIPVGPGEIYDIHVYTSNAAQARSATLFTTVRTAVGLRPSLPRTAVGENLVLNAAMISAGAAPGFSQWPFNWYAGTDTPIAGRTPALFNNETFQGCSKPGVPHFWQLTYTDYSNGVTPVPNADMYMLDAVDSNNLVPVTPNLPYQFFARLGPQGCSASVAIGFVGADKNTWVGFSTGNVVPTLYNYGGAQVTHARMEAEGALKYSVGEMVAPANAAYARIIVYINNWQNTQTTGAPSTFIEMPMLARVSAMNLGRLAWNDANRILTRPVVPPNEWTDIMTWVVDSDILLPMTLESPGSLGVLSLTQPRVPIGTDIIVTVSLTLATVASTAATSTLINLTYLDEPFVFSFQYTWALPVLYWDEPAGRSANSTTHNSSVSKVFRFRAPIAPVASGTLRLTYTNTLANTVIKTGSSMRVEVIKR